MESPPPACAGQRTARGFCPRLALSHTTAMPGHDSAYAAGQPLWWGKAGLLHNIKGAWVSGLSLFAAAHLSVSLLLHFFPLLISSCVTWMVTSRTSACKRSYSSCGQPQGAAGLLPRVAP